jgi:hypothetical protein
LKINFLRRKERQLLASSGRKQPDKCGGETFARRLKKGHLRIYLCGGLTFYKSLFFLLQIFSSERIGQPRGIPE